MLDSGSEDGGDTEDEEVMHIFDPRQDVYELFFNCVENTFSKVRFLSVQFTLKEHKIQPIYRIGCMYMLLHYLDV